MLYIEAFDFTDSFTIQSQSDYNMILDQISLWFIPYLAIFSTVIDILALAALKERSARGKQYIYIMP